MATLSTEIQFLSPQKTIIINNVDGNGLGISDPYQLSVKFRVIPKNTPRITVDFLIRIENNQLFSFDDGSTTLSCPFADVKSGDVEQTVSFRIMNTVPLTGMQLVLAIESNDSNDPNNKDFDSETYDVSYE